MVSSVAAHQRADVVQPCLRDIVIRRQVLIGHVFGHAGDIFEVHQLGSHTVVLPVARPQHRHASLDVVGFGGELDCPPADHARLRRIDLAHEARE